jgi:hypothetical protein
MSCEHRTFKFSSAMQKICFDITKDFKQGESVKNKPRKMTLIVLTQAATYSHSDRRSRGERAMCFPAVILDLETFCCQ